MASAELFEDPFDPDEYVERLAWRTPGGGTKGGAQGFNPEVILYFLLKLLHKIYSSQKICLKMIFVVCKI